MYLYLGQNTVVPKASVVGVFDLDNTSISKRTRETLAIAEKKGLVRAVMDDIPRSFVVCEEEGEVTFYLSQISSATLQRRWEENIVTDV